MVESFYVFSLQGVTSGHGAGPGGIRVKFGACLENRMLSAAQTTILTGIGKITPSAKKFGKIEDMDTLSRIAKYSLGVSYIQEVKLIEFWQF